MSSISPVFATDNTAGIDLEQEQLVQEALEDNSIEDLSYDLPSSLLFDKLLYMSI